MCDLVKNGVTLISNRTTDDHNNAHKQLNKKDYNNAPQSVEHYATHKHINIYSN